jgi:hypothetical protein
MNEVINKSSCTSEIFLATQQANIAIIHHHFGSLDFFKNDIKLLGVFTISPTNFDSNIGNTQL